MVYTSNCILKLPKNFFILGCVIDFKKDQDTKVANLFSIFLPHLYLLLGHS